jgi:hypothetical protein
MFLAWLLLGAVIGAVNGLDKSRPSEFVSMVFGGMMALPIAGVFLGVIGGDVRGSIVGAAAGLLGCGLATLDGAAAIPLGGISLIAIIGALLGATGLLFVRFLIWKYTLIFTAIGWFLGLTPVPAKAWIPPSHLLFPRRPATSSVRARRRANHASSTGNVVRRPASSPGSSR